MLVTSPTNGVCKIKFLNENFAKNFFVHLLQKLFCHKPIKSLFETALALHVKGCATPESD